MSSAEELKQFNQALIAKFRNHGGDVNGWHSLLLLTTNGAKSGLPHTTPVVYSTDGNRIILIAAHFGEAKHPAWYRNFVANPDVTVELGRQHIRMRAVVAEGEERDRLFNQHAEQVLEIVEYQSETTRRIPVVVLERMSSSSPGIAPLPDTKLPMAAPTNHHLTVTDQHGKQVRAASQRGSHRN